MRHCNDCKNATDEIVIADIQLKRRIRHLEKQLDAHARILERICGRLNIKYKKLSR